MKAGSGTPFEVVAHPPYLPDLSPMNTYVEKYKNVIYAVNR